MKYVIVKPFANKNHVKFETRYNVKVFVVTQKAIVPENNSVTSEESNYFSIVPI